MDSEVSVKFDGPLYLKSEGKKVWKKVEFCYVSNGLHYRPPAGKGKTGLTCLSALNDVCIYVAVGWRKKYKSPTEFGLSLKVSVLSDIIDAM